MIFILYIIIVICILFLIPIPIKLTFNYIDKDVSIFIYNINIDKKVSTKRRKAIHRIKIREDQVKIFLNTLKISIDSLKEIKFKPKVKIKINLSYGLNDAALTAMAYGVLCMLCPMVLQLLDSIFKLKDPHFNVTPEYNKYILKLEINSIIFINLVKVIYILIVVYKNLRRERNLNVTNT